MELSLAVNAAVIVLLAVSNFACHLRQNRLFKKSLDAHAQRKSVADKYASLVNDYRTVANDYGAVVSQLEKSACDLKGAVSMIEALQREKADAWGIRSALAR